MINQSIKREIHVAFILGLLFMGLLSPFLPSIPSVEAATQANTVNQILFVNSMNNASTQWQTHGNSPYLNNATGTHDIYIVGAGGGKNNSLEGNFGFAHASVLFAQVKQVILYVEAYKSPTLDFNYAHIYNASGTWLGKLAPLTSYSWNTFNITNTFNTQDKINKILIYFKFEDFSNNKSFYIDRAYLNVTGTIYTQTSRDTWAQLLWNNDTAAKVNATLPFVFLGSQSLTKISTEELLSGALLYAQTHDINDLQEPENVCLWLNQTAVKKHIWFTYDTTPGSSGWQTTPINPTAGAGVIMRLAIYANIVPKWKPLLQQVVNEWIRIYLPLSTARVHFEVWPNDTVYLDPNNAYRDYCTASYQSSGIIALTLASAVLRNATVRNLAYRMIMNYTNYDPVHAPHHLSTHAIYPNGTLDLNTYYFSKEDEDYANYMSAMETFYYYYPQNTTVRSRIYDQAWDGAQGMWNSTGQCWNYRTDIRSGSLDLNSGPPYLAVHGFGMTDEVFIGAYLIFGNTTWRDRARQDFDSLVIQGKIMTHGIIDHSTYHPNIAQEAWNVHGRRTAAILSDLFNNQTYLRWANMLFWNVTGQMSRKYGLAEAINPTTDADSPGFPNTRENLGEFLAYINKTATITSFHSLFTNLGLPVTGIIPPPPPKWLSVTLSSPNAKSQTSLSVTFSYTPYVVGTAFRNASLWTNSSGVWQKVTTDSAVQNLTQNIFTYSYGSYGTYVWNVKVYNSTMGVFAPSNYTISLMSVHVSPTSGVMDVGQSKLFTSSIVGGFSPFTYQWYLNSAPVSGATGSTWMFTPSSSGSYSVYVNATDSTGTTAKSNIVIVTVNPPPTVSISPTSVTMDVGQSKLFTSTVSGGTSPFSYQWYLNDTPVSGATSSSWTFTPSSPASYTVYVNVTDDVGFTAKSNIVSVTVNPPPTVSISPTSVTMDVGQSKLFTSTTSGGTPPYSYQWYLNGAPVSGATDPTWTFAPASPGSYTVYVQVTDSVEFQVDSNQATVTVNPPPSVSISPTSVTMDVGQSKLFTSTASGGTLPYSYQWYLNGAPVSGATNPTWTFTPISIGSYTVYVEVTDSVSMHADSNTATVTVNPAPSVSILPTSVVMDLGQSQLFTSTVSGGTSPFSYQWYLDGSPVSGATSPTWTYTPSSTGSHSVYLKITDAVSAVATSNTVPVTVNPAPSVIISPTSAAMDIGQSQLFISSVSGGTSPYSYQWYLNGTAVPGATLSTWTFTPNSVGHYNVYVNVTDSVNFRTKSNIAPVIVNPLPAVSVSPTSVVMDVGQSQLFTSTASGGTSPYTYQWYLNGALVPAATGATWTFTPISAGSYTVYVKVTDSVNVQATSNTVPVTVNPALSVTIAPISVVMDVGQSQLFTSTASGGTLPYVYQWYLNGNPVSGATNPTWTFNPSSSGYYTVYLKVTDNVGASTSSPISTVTVNPQLVATISPSSATIYLGQSQTFISSASGGTSPYSYQWYLNGSVVSGATSSSWTFTPNSTGTYEIYVQVTDTVGMVAQSGNSQLSVNSPPSVVVTISPSAAVIDLGQSVSFNSSVTGGTLPFTYQWYLNGTAVSGATSSNWLFTPASIGYYQIYVNVTDSVNIESKSNIAFVTVNSLPSVTISPTSSTLDVGQSEIFTSAVSGGTSAYTYQWYLNDNPVYGATSSSWTFTPSSTGSFTVYVNVTDSVGLEAKSNTASVTVNPALSVSISPTSVTLDVGQPQQFNSTVSGGTSPYSYQWYLNGAPVSGATDPTWTFTPTSPGSYTIYVEVTDNIGVQVTSNIAIATVTSMHNHDVTVTNVTSSKTIVGQGFPVSINVTVTNYGDYPETFKVTAYANAIEVASQNVTLLSGNSATIILDWNTTSFAYGNYTISAYAWPVPYETNTANNNFTDGVVKVTIPGDINGDGVVNIKDASLIGINWQQYVPAAPSNVDINGDGVVNIKDASIVGVNWLRHT